MHSKVKSLFIMYIFIPFTAITFANGTELPEDVLMIKASKEARINGPEERILLVSDVANLIATAFDIPVSSEEPWRPEYTPLPFKLTNSLQIEAGTTLGSALKQILSETGDVLTYDLTQRVLIVYPKYAEHRILSCADTKVIAEMSNKTVWEAMKQVAKTVNCQKKALSVLTVRPQPWLNLQKVPKEYTEEKCVQLEQQETTVRLWLCKIIQSSKIPISYKLGISYSPTRFPEIEPKTTITVYFNGPGLQRSGEDTSMASEERLWWMKEMEDLRCED